MSDDPTEKPAKPDPALDKRARLSEALRQNLKRRKAQARARKGTGETTEETSGKQTQRDTNRPSDDRE